MLHRSTLDKASRPGLRFQGWKSLPLGSKIAVTVLGLIALIAILAPVIAPYSPGATGLAEAKTTSYIEGVGEVTATDPVVAPSMSHLITLVKLGIYSWILQIQFNIYVSCM